MPDPDYAGQDWFTYVVRDGDGFQQLATASLTVTPLNDPPVLTPAAPAHDPTKTRCTQFR